MISADSQANEGAILDARAARLARAHAGGEQRELDSTVVVVRVGEETLGLPLDRLRRIVPTPPISHLPRVPSWNLGVVQLRGELLCAIHVGRWLGVDATADAAFLVVLEGEPGLLGLLVEEVVGIREVFADELDSEILADSRRSGRPLRGTTRDLLTLLDVPRLFDSSLVAGSSSPEQALPAAAAG